MHTRRQFLTRAGGAGAVVILVPQAALGAAKSRELLRGGRFSQGVLSGDPTPNGITLSTIVDDVEGAGGVRLEVARDSTSRTSSREVDRHRRGHNHAVKARVNGLKPGEDYFYRFETSGATARSGASRRRSRPTRGSPCASRSTRAPTTRTATTTPTR